jgi:hypothetical protein
VQNWSIQTRSIPHLASVFYCLFLSSVLAENQPSPVKFTPQQVDRILVLDRLNNREEDTRRLAAIAYSVHNGGQLLLTGQPNKPLLQAATPSGIYDKDTQIIVAGPKGAISPLNQLAAQKAALLDGFSLRGSTIEKVADFSVDAIVLAGLQKQPVAAGMVKLLYPPTKEAVERLVERDPRAPGLDKEFTIEWATWAYDQVRRGTPEGLALAPYVPKYQGIEPKKDNSTTEPVQKAADRLLTIKTAKTANEALEKLHDLKDTETTIVDGINDIKGQLDAKEQQAQKATAAAKALADRVRPVQNAADSLALTGYLFSIAGNPDAARTVGGLANATTGVANLMERAATAAPMTLAAGYVGVALTVFSALQSSKQESSPFSALFSMLANISAQIENLRREMANTLAVMDARLGLQMRQLSTIGDASHYDIAQIRIQIGGLETLLQNINADMARRFAVSAGLILRGEDRRCFRWTGEQTLRPLTRDEFLNCRDVYLARAVTDALDNTSPLSVEPGAPPSSEKLFPFAANYEALRRDISDLHAENPGRLANPAEWFRATSFLLGLIKSQSAYLRDVSKEMLDPVIDIGEDLRKFVETLAVRTDQAGSHLREDRFNGIIEKLYSLEFEMLTKVQRQIEHAPIPAQVTQGLRQAANIDFRYPMLATNGLKPCEDVKIQLKSVESVSLATGGGGHGFSSLITPDNAYEDLGMRKRVRYDLRARVEEELRKIRFDSLSFDKSLLRAIDNAVVLMEQTKYKGAEMSYCVSQFDITRLNMTANTEVDFDIRVKVFLTAEGLTSSSTFLVQELVAQPKTTSPFYHFYYLDSINPDPVIRVPWAQFKGKFDRIFRPAPNKEADENLAKVRSAMEEFFEEKRNLMFDTLLSGTQAERRELDRLKSELLMLSVLGLNNNHAVVRRWLKSFEDEALFPTPSDLFDPIIRKGAALDEIRTARVEATDHLKNLITDVARYADIGPNSDMLAPLAARLSELRKIQVLRTALVSAPASHKAH